MKKIEFLLLYSFIAVAGHISVGTAKNRVWGSALVVRPTSTSAQMPTPDPSPVSATKNSPKLSLTDTATGTNRAVAVEAGGQFRLVFEANDNWGLDQWYDLVNDPQAATNLLAVQSRKQVSPDVDENAMFQWVFGGTNPDDAKLYTVASTHYFPDAPRDFHILLNTRDEVVVETISKPAVNAVGVLDAVTGDIIYRIYPDGRIFISANMITTAPQKAKIWLVTLGLGDPTPGEHAVCNDAIGWIRATDLQNPYQWTRRSAKYLYAYYGDKDGSEVANWAVASIILIPDPKNPLAGHQYCHGWPGFKRWALNYPLEVPAGKLAMNYMIQLGTKNSKVLPDIRTAPVADKIYAGYIRGI